MGRAEQGPEGAGDEERAAWITLACARVEGRKARAAVLAAGGAGAFLGLGDSGWREAGVGEAGRRRLAAARTGRAGGRDLEEAARRGIHVLSPGEPSYPALLAHLTDPPPFLYLAGDAGALGGDHPIAIVGTRAASPAALTWSERAGADLAGAGCLVVSGGARGIDAAVHRGALARGRTAAVLGSGLLDAYPPEHAELFQAIAARGGCLVSEFPLTAPPRRENFPRRNRLIAALSVAVVVVEAPERSGALSTVTHALDLGREIFCVPQAPGVKSAGTLRLLREGARAVGSAAEILEDLGFDLGAGDVGSAGTARPAGADILRAEDLMASEGIARGEAERRLLTMELDGTIERLPDGSFRRVGHR